MEKKTNKKGLFYGCSSILLLLIGLSGFLPIKTITFSIYHIIFLVIGMIGLLLYCGVDFKGKSSNSRSFTANVLIFIFCLLGLIFIPSLLTLLLKSVIKNSVLCLVIADLLYIGLLISIFYNDLKKEANIYFSDFKNKFKYSFKIYILGYMAMIFFNLLIYVFVKDISSNESQVRELLYSSTILTLFSIAVIAPLSEELVFRKSLSTLFKNKWAFVLVSGLLFGGAHILTNILNNDFVIKDLLYVLPYGALGASFALMDYDTKTTFSSIVIHSLHNTLTGILLLITYFGGK